MTNLTRLLLITTALIAGEAALAGEQVEDATVPLPEPTRWSLRTTMYV